MSDLNEVLQHVPLGELTAAADAGPVLVPREWEPVAQLGIDRLTAASLEHDAEKRRRIVTDLTGDEQSVLSIATAYVHRRLEVDRLYGLIEEVSGISKPLGRLQTNVKLRVKEVNERASSKVTHGGLDFLTRDLGITGLKVPDGYTVTRSDGVMAGAEQVSHKPIIILKTAIYEGEHRDEIAWLDSRGWHKRVVDRRTLSDSRAILQLAVSDVPVTSVNAVQLVDYFSKFRAANEETLQPIHMTPGFGWTDDCESFLIGQDYIGKPALLGATQRHTKGYDVAGTWEGYCAAVEKYVKPHPRLSIALLVGVAAPLLTPLEASGFTVSFIGVSGTGKTTAARVCASTMGSCIRADGEKVIRSWNTSSSVGVNAMLGQARNVPCILDDTKLARFPEIIHQALYGATDGHPRSQGDADGNERQMKTWRTILLSTGESSLLSAGIKSGGAAARVFEFNGSTTVGQPDDRFFNDMVTDLQANRGHLVRRVAQWLLENKEKWSTLRNRRQKYINELHGKTGVENRLNENVATMKIAADVCREVGLNLDFGFAIEEIKKAATRATVTANRARGALDLIWLYTSTRRKSVMMRLDQREPYGGFIGEMMGGTAWSTLGVRQDIFRSCLKDEGYVPEDIYEALTHLGYLVLDPDGRNPASPNLGGARLITIKREAF